MKNLFIILILILTVFLSETNVLAQKNNRIQEIIIESNSDIPEILILDGSTLEVGSVLTMDNASESIRRLWHLGLFSNVQISSEDVENGLRITIKVDVLPSANSIKTNGFEELDEKEVLNTIKLVRNIRIGERKIARIKKQILDMYHEKGFLQAEVNLEAVPLPDDPNKVDVTLTINEGKKIKIKSINLEGNQNISDKKLKKLMETKEDRWYRSGEFKQEVLDEDKKKIVALYKTKGFRDAIVMRDTTYFDEKREKIILTIFIAEGKKYKFGETAITGNLKFSNEELLPYVKYNKGDIYNEDLITMSYYEMMTLYNNNGYLKATVNPVQIAHGDTVDINYDFAEGTISKVSKVIIEGNVKTIEKVIRREITLLPGESFNRDKLLRSQRDIRMLNYFKDVSIDYEPAENEDDVNIKIAVAEKNTGIASMGAGYSERDKLVGTLAFSNANLFGRGQTIGFNWDMGARRKAFQISFTEPWLFDTPTSFTFDVYNIVRSDYTSAFDEEKRRGGYIRFGRRLSWPDDNSRAFVSYRLEDIDYSNPSEYYKNYLVTGKTSSLSFIIIRDSRDMPQFATDGSRTSATVEIAGGPLKGDLSYYKYMLNNETFTPVFWKISLITRSRLGFLKGYKENTWVPYSERFMPGGISFDGIVRGYENRQVSPRINREEIGGETMFVNNIELQFPLVAQMVYGIAFYDFGNSWRNLSETMMFDFKRSVGVGVRLFVPQIGLIGFDFGYGFDKLEGSDVISGWRTHFQFGNMNY